MTGQQDLAKAAAGAAESMRRFVEFFTRHTVRRSKHAGGRVGQKAKAKARRRGTHGKAVRRRHLAARGEVVRTRARYASLGMFLREQRERQP